MTNDGPAGERAARDEVFGVVEAARALGVTPDTVRAKLRRGTIGGFRDDAGRWRVLTPVPGGRREGRELTMAGAGEAEALREHVTDLLDERAEQAELLAAERARVEELRQRVRWLETQLDRATAPSALGKLVDVLVSRLQRK